MLGRIVDGNVHENGQWYEEEPSDDRTKVNQERDPCLHEPTDGEHGRCQGHTDVGVSEGVPGGLFGPVGLSQGNPVHRT